MQKQAAYLSLKFFDDIYKKMLLLLLLSFFGLSCASGDAGSNNPFAKMKMKEVKHSNGLEITMPETATANTTDDGFLLVPPPSRGMSEMSVALTANEAGLLGKEIQEKQINGRTIKYRIEKSEGDGSSGDSYSITAQEQIKSGCITYQQSDMAKLNAPPFDFFWLIVKQTKANS